MAKDRTFLFNLEWMEALRGYPTEVISEVLLCIVRYAETGEQIEMKPLVKMAFSFIKRDMDRLKEWENEQKRKRREAGRTGGLAKKGGQYIVTEEVSIDCSTHGDNDNEEAPISNAKQTEANVSKTKQEQANGSKAKQTEANGSYNNNINSNSNIKENVEKKSDTRFSPPTIEEVRAYCAEKGYTNVDPERFCYFYESKGWMVGKNKMKNWRSAVSNWSKDRENGNQRTETYRGAGLANHQGFAGQAGTTDGTAGAGGSAAAPKNYGDRF